MESRHVLTEEDFVGGEEHQENEIVIKILGERQYACKATDIQAVLTAELGPTQEGQKRKIYRMQESTK